MILYQLERIWDVSNLSHFCCMTETYLRIPLSDSNGRTL